MVCQFPVPLLLAATSAVSGIKPKPFIFLLYADCSNNQMIVHFLLEHIQQCRLHGVVINLQMDE
jgi:hypothetical protein